MAHIDVACAEKILEEHDKACCTDNCVSENPDVSVWHLLVSLLKFCEARAVDFDAQLAEAKQFVTEEGY